MNIVEQLSAVVLLVDILFGVSFGVFGGAIFASVRENRDMTLLRQAPDHISAGARVIFGVYTRDDDGYLQSLRPGGRPVARKPRDNDCAGPHRQEPDQ